VPQPGAPGVVRIIWPSRRIGDGSVVRSYGNASNTIPTVLTADQTGSIADSLSLPQYSITVPTSSINNLNLNTTTTVQIWETDLIKQTNIRTTTSPTKPRENLYYAQLVKSRYGLTFPGKEIAASLNKLDTYGKLGDKLPKLLRTDGATLFFVPGSNSLSVVNTNSWLLNNKVNVGVGNPNPRYASLSFKTLVDSTSGANTNIALYTATAIADDAFSIGSYVLLTDSSGNQALAPIVSYNPAAGTSTFGQELFTTTTSNSSYTAATNQYTFNWTAPAGVLSVSVVAVGGGSGGSNYGFGGEGGSSYFLTPSTVFGGGGLVYNYTGYGSRTFVGDGGGLGGQASDRILNGGGGASGYSGAGGTNGASGGNSGQNPAFNSGGGAAGGNSNSGYSAGGGGGGVGVWGKGTEGTTGTSGGSGTGAGGASGGSGGANGGGGGNGTPVAAPYYGSGAASATGITGGIDGTAGSKLGGSGGNSQYNSGSGGGGGNNSVGGGGGGGGFGGGGGGTYAEVGGDGGSLGYRNNISVTPGQTYTVVVGGGGAGGSSTFSGGGGGGGGAVRIMWPGTIRSFPTTLTADQTGATTETKKVISIPTANISNLDITSVLTVQLWDPEVITQLKVRTSLPPTNARENLYYAQLVKVKYGQQDKTLYRGSAIIYNKTDGILATANTTGKGLADPSATSKAPVQFWN
jgi:hypothetical protein